MPSIRTLGVAGLSGIGVALYFALWLRWPAFLAIAAGATLMIVMLLFAASLGEDPEKADAAWRAAAPDLVRRERDSGVDPDLGPGGPVRRPAGASEPALPDEAP